MILADTHVHLYPDYELEQVLRTALVRLHALASEAMLVVCLTERHDCHIYAKLCEQGAVPGADNLAVEVLDGGRCLRVAGWPDLPPLLVLPGRQIVARERVELLCLGQDAAIEDGEPAQQTVRRIHEVDGLAVLPWGVGKWMLRRKAVVATLLDTFGPSELMLADSAMRPWFWTEPGLLRKARLAGYRVLAGSDPLPFEPQGAWIGRYATQLDAAWDPEAPSASIRNALQGGVIRRVGRRPGPVGFMRRMAG